MKHSSHIPTHILYTGRSRLPAFQRHKSWPLVISFTSFEVTGMATPPLLEALAHSTSTHLICTNGFSSSSNRKFPSLCLTTTLPLRPSSGYSRFCLPTCGVKNQSPGMMIKYIDMNLFTVVLAGLSAQVCYRYDQENKARKIPV